MKDELRELVARIDHRFTSGNAVPVERAPIKADEWQQIRAALATSANLKETQQ